MDRYRQGEEAIFPPGTWHMVQFHNMPVASGTGVDPQRPRRHPGQYARPPGVVRHETAPPNWTPEAPGHQCVHLLANCFQATPQHWATAKSGNAPRWKRSLGPGFCPVRPPTSQLLPSHPSALGHSQKQCTPLKRSLGPGFCPVRPPTSQLLPSHPSALGHSQKQRTPLKRSAWSGILINTTHAGLVASSTTSSATKPDPRATARVRLPSSKATQNSTNIKPDPPTICQSLPWIGNRELKDPWDPEDWDPGKGSLASEGPQ